MRSPPAAPRRPRRPRAAPRSSASRAVRASPSSPSSSPSAAKSGRGSREFAKRNSRVGCPARSRRHGRADGRDRDRDPVEHRVAAERVDELLVAERVRVDARPLGRHARAARRARRGPSRAGARRRRPSRRSVTSTGARTVPVRLRTSASSPSASPSRAASSGWTCSVQRSGPETSRGRLCIHELLERSWRRPISTSASGSCSRPSASRSRGTSATIGSGASSIRPDGVRSTSGSRGASGPRSIAVRRRLEVGEREVVGPAAQQDVEQPLRAGARRDRGQHRLDVDALAPRELARDEVVERPDVGHARPARPRCRRGAGASPTRPAARPRAGSRAATSSPRCGPRAGRARGRSARAAAATARAGSRRRGAWTR